MSLQQLTSPAAPGEIVFKLYALGGKLLAILGTNWNEDDGDIVRVSDDGGQTWSTFTDVGATKPLVRVIGYVNNRWFMMRYESNLYTHELRTSTDFISWVPCTGADTFWPENFIWFDGYFYSGVSLNGVNNRTPRSANGVDWVLEDVSRTYNADTLVVFNGEIHSSSALKSPQGFSKSADGMVWTSEGATSVSVRIFGDSDAIYGRSGGTFTNTDFWHRVDGVWSFTQANPNVGMFPTSKSGPRPASAIAGKLVAWSSDGSYRGVYSPDSGWTATPDLAVAEAGLRIQNYALDGGTEYILMADADFNQSKLYAASYVISEGVEDESLTFSDETTYESSNLLESSFTLSDARTEVREQTISSSIALTDAQRQAGSSLVETTITLTDEQDSRTAQTVESTLLFSDAREAVSAGSREVESRLTFTDAIRQGGTNEVEDTLTFTDEQQQQGTSLLESVLTFDDALSQTGLVDDNLVSTLAFSDELELRVHSNIELIDTLIFTAQTFYKDPGAIAWVMNTETGAPSWYSNWQFVDMVQIGDRVLAVGPEGLVELGAETDAGEFIDASISYGFMDYGTDQKKRVDSFWFGYSSDDVLEVSVETLGNTVYTYSMEARNAEQARNNRIRPGKGLNARYWRVGINNVGGCDFDVDSLGADVVPTSRRL